MRYLLVIFISGIVCSAFGCSKGKPVSADVPADTTAENVHSKDTLTYFSIGNGVNLQPSYYNNGQVHFGWSLMKEYKAIKAVRIEIEPMIDIQTAKSWIAEAINNGYTVIVTYHKSKVLGSNDPKDLVDAALWWKTNYNALTEAGDFYINLMNEWGNHQLSANEYAQAYNKAIAIVRQVYDGTVIIDCPGWGQETAVAAAAVKGTRGILLKDTNIVLSVHIYPNGWNQARNHAFQKSDLDELAAAGRACMVGEFGNGISGKADWDGMVEYAKKLGWPVFGWCWNGDGGKMNMVSPKWADNPAAQDFKTNDYFNKIYSLIR